MPKLRIRLGTALALTALATAGAAAAPAIAPAKTLITMSGSTSVAPLVALLARKYVKVYPKRARFKLLQGGSDVGVADASAGRVSIGNSSRDPKPSDSGVVFNKIARDAICVITNNGNAVPNLSQTDVQNIFSGKTGDWSAVPGAGVTGPIDIIVRTAASGTQDAFQKIFLGSAKVAGSAAQKASNGLIQSSVQSDPNGIGYVSLDFTNGVHPVNYKGNECNLRNAKSGTYEGVRNFWMVTRGVATGAVKTFIGWIQASHAANAIIGTHWVPLHE